MLYLSAMNRLPNISIYSATFLLLLPCPAAAVAKLPIDLEVVTEPGLPIAAPQAWVRLLGKMDLGSVRIRGMRSGDRPQLVDRSQGGSPRYRLVAVLNSRSELVLPQKRFRTTDRQALQKYLKQLPAQAAYNADDRGRFGLTEKQFRLVYTELAQPVGFSTAALAPREILARLEKKLRAPITGSHRAALRTAEPISSELKNLSAGTALAITLRSAGLTLRPEQLPGKPLQLSIALYDPQKEAWPVGWKPAVSSRQSAPQLFELRNIELNGFTLSQALTALAPALKIPVMLDHWVLAQQQINPAKIQVAQPNKRTYLKATVSKLASQAKLTAEVRVDEQEQPFLWLTRFGKNSRPAIK